MHRYIQAVSSVSYLLASEGPAKTTQSVSPSVTAKQLKKVFFTILLRGTWIMLNLKPMKEFMKFDVVKSNNHFLLTQISVKI